MGDGEGGGGAPDNLQYAAHQLKCLERDIAFKGSRPIQRIKRTGLSPFSDARCRKRRK